MRDYVVLPSARRNTVERSWRNFCKGVHISDNGTARCQVQGAIGPQTGSGVLVRPMERKGLDPGSQVRGWLPRPVRVDPHRLVTWRPRSKGLGRYGFMALNFSAMSGTVFFTVGLHLCKTNHRHAGTTGSSKDRDACATGRAAGKHIVDQDYVPPSQL